MSDIPPVGVTIIDTTKPGSPLTNGDVAVTPDHQPNLVVTLVKPIEALAIRFVYQYATTLVGFVTAGLTPSGSRLLNAPDFWHLLLICASFSIAGPTVAMLKDLVTIFGNLEASHPLLTGSV